MAMLRIHVVPNAKIDKVTGEHGGAIKIKLRAPAFEQKANRALIRFLAEKLDIPQRDVSIERGEKSREKVIRIDSLDAQAINDRLRSGL